MSPQTHNKQTLIKSNGVTKQKTINDYLERIEKSLLGIKQVLTLDEACIYTGISKTYMYRLTSTRQIPFSKNRKFIYFDRNILDKWLLENPIKTRSEIEDQALSYITKKA